MLTVEQKLRVAVRLQGVGSSIKYSSIESEVESTIFADYCGQYQQLKNLHQKKKKRSTVAIESPGPRRKSLKCPISCAYQWVDWPVHSAKMANYSLLPLLCDTTELSVHLAGLLTPRVSFIALRDNLINALSSDFLLLKCRKDVMRHPLLLRVND